MAEHGIVEPMRVAIVETSPAMHLAIAAVLEGAVDVRIVEHARSLPELWTAGPEILDVLVADLRACHGSRAALGQLRERYPGLRLVVTTETAGPTTRMPWPGWPQTGGCKRAAWPEAW